jgi:2-iminobutanoate/2-iminopropanoate deaminase
MSDSKSSGAAIHRHQSDRAPAAIGPATGELVSGGFEAEARKVFQNLGAVLEASGCGFRDVLKATVYLADMSDFPVLNGIYAEAFGEHKPARSTVAVAALPKGARVEIDLIARRS